MAKPDYWSSMIQRDYQTPFEVDTVEENISSMDESPSPMVHFDLDPTNGEGLSFLCPVGC
jgi:hypothetical protein